MGESRIHNRDLWNLLLILALTGYIAVKDVAAPFIREFSGKSAVQAKVTSDAKIFQLEVVISKLGNLSETVAAQSEAILGLKTTVDRLERKLDTHIEKK